MLAIASLILFTIEAYSDFNSAFLLIRLLIKFRIFCNELIILLITLPAKVLLDRLSSVTLALSIRLSINDFSASHLALIICLYLVSDSIAFTLSSTIVLANIVSILFTSLIILSNLLLKLVGGTLSSLSTLISLALGVGIIPSLTCSYSEGYSPSFIKFILSIAYGSSVTAAFSLLTLLVVGFSSLDSLTNTSLALLSVPSI